MITQNTVKKGKSVEYLIISELLKNDFDIYVPVTDVEGVDVIVKSKEGAYVEIKIKSRVILGYEEQFAVKDFEPRENFFIVCHNITGNKFYVMPSIIFYKKGGYKFNRQRKFRFMRFSQIEKYENFKNEDGIALLKKALKNPANILNSIKNNI
ncbi:hypothetical protein HYY73_05620 [Candidatus Woesearchaeota archaeon]|nr:hypothetical protein [Candidatus Woesearchaeota archaeon]